MNHLASFFVGLRAHIAFTGEADEEGQSLVEYAFILVMVALVVILTLIILGNQTRNMFANISAGLTH